MRVAVLFSGGKDSVFTTFYMFTQGFDPILITIKPERYSMMFHHQNIDKTTLQAKALGIKQYFLETDDSHWHERLKSLLKKLRVGGIAAGAVASEYQKRRIERLGEELGIPTYTPLWHKEDELMQEVLKYFETYITAVAAEGLDAHWLGEKFEKLADAKIKNIHPFLEGGEGETFVAHTPFFKKRIKIKSWKKKWDKTRGEAEIIL